MKGLVRALLLVCGIGLVGLPVYAASNPADVPTVPSVAALQALGQAAPLYPAIMALGYFTPGDGGGGIFGWNAASTATVDGGTIFTAAGVSTGRWVRQMIPSGPLNVLMFGARCDDSTNDATALQNSETAAQSLGLAITYPSTNLCKTGTPIIPGIGVDHYCPMGMNFGDSGGGTSGRCGVFGNVSASQYAFDLENANGTAVIQSPTWHDMYITSIGGGIRLNNPAHGFTDDGSSQAPMFYTRVNNVNITATKIAFQCSKCFYLNADGGQWSGTPTTLDLEGSDITVVRHVNFLGNTNQDILLQSHGTFGNGNHIEDNFIECPFSAGISCITDNARISYIQNNNLECQGGSVLPATIDVGANFNTYIENNTIACSNSFATHWLTIADGGLLLVVTGNQGNTSAFPSASFNSGGTASLYVSSELQQIFHSGNTTEAGFPFSSYNNIPEARSLASGTLMTWRPGATSYNANSSNYGSTVKVLNGAYQQPAAAGGNELDFNQYPSVMTGTLDICFLASSSNVAQVETLVAQDNAVTVHTGTFTMTGGLAPTWYCYKAGAYATAASVQLKNLDTGHGAEVDIYQVVITQEL